MAPRKSNAKRMEKEAHKVIHTKKKAATKEKNRILRNGDNKPGHEHHPLEVYPCNDGWKVGHTPIYIAVLFSVLAWCVSMYYWSE